MHNLLEILILTLTKFTKLPVLRYLVICNVLYIWHIRVIPTYRVYRLYDINECRVSAYSHFCTNGTCRNTDGSYECICNRGFINNGTTECVGKNYMYLSISNFSYCYRVIDHTHTVNLPSLKSTPNLNHKN